MRKLALSLASLAIFCAFAPGAHAQLKVGIVDMNTVFVQFYKTKEAEVQINEARTAAKKELDAQLDGLKKSMEEINKLNQDIARPELSKDAKDKATKQRDEKIAEARTADRDVAEFRNTKDKMLQEQFMRMRKNIIEEIMVVVNDKVKAAGYDLVLDKSGMSMGQVNVVLYSRADLDFSKDIIETLNKNAPKSPKAAN